MKKLLLVLTTVALFACGINKPYQPDFSTEEGRKDFAQRAWIISQSFVKQNLKTPSTAEFPYSEYSWSDPTSSNSIVIKSYVDAQNSFGAQIRKNFSIKVRYNGGEWSDINNWNQVEIEFY